MFGGNVKMAIVSLRSTRWRSLLAMLGIVIGIASVVTIVSLGEGVKRQVINQLNHFGKDLITVRPGQPQAYESNSIIFGGGKNVGSLSKHDWDTVARLPDVEAAVPISFVSGNAESDGQSFPSTTIIGTNDQLPNVLNQNIDFGVFFGAAEAEQHVAVIGQSLAQKLFQENVPIGRVLTIRGQDFVVRGVFEKFSASPVTFGADLNSAIFIPYATAQEISRNSAQITQLLVKPHSSAQYAQTARNIKQHLLEAHGGQADFSVLTETENAHFNAQVVNTFTNLIAGIAAISLLVGGVGIMTIMLVSVTERTREIGIRKAVGATNRQLLGQFLIEAMILSGLGGVFGLIGALMMNYFIRIFTSLGPVVTWQSIVLATGVAFLIGVVFGMVPALRAARKDPIDALRYE